MSLSERLKRSGEPTPIVGECPHCRLPIYATDSYEPITDWPWEGRELYHSGCAWRTQVRYHQNQLEVSVAKLRVLGCKVSMQIVTPIT